MIESDALDDCSRCGCADRPEWPVWKPLRLSDHPTITALANQLDAIYSDVWFTSCYAWDIHDDVVWSTIDGNLILRMPDYSSREPLTILAGVSNVPQVVKVLLADGPCVSLDLVPAHTAQLCDGDSDVVVAIDRDNADYLRDLSDLVRLEGKQFRHARNQVSRFIKGYPNYTVTVRRGRSVADLSARREVDAIFEAWERTTDVSQDPSIERAALQRLLDVAPHFDLLLVTVYVDSQAVAFYLVEILTNAWSFGHFLKADRTVDGASTAVRMFAAQQLVAAGCRWFNEEQDLGLKGLRMSKSRLGPVKLLEKFTIRMATSVQVDGVLTEKEGN